MSLDDKFIPVRTVFYNIVEGFFQKIAGLFGYPENPGMPTISKLSNESYVIDTLPSHQTFWPPMQRPETWFEMFVGPSPKVDAVPRYIYESKEEGFYNFYIENYKNIYFLPDWLSEFLQVRLNLCLDITFLETIREVLFVGLMVYSQIVILRIALSWFIYINPYTFPWCYLVAAVDWTEDVLQGIVPSILGVNITGSVFLGILGVLADSLNHLVFTMPFLPSEGEETKLLINQEMKDVLVFHYLPILWYRHPIPDDIRNFWYKERPDILNYMQKAYQDLNINFLPNRVINEQRMIQKLQERNLTGDLSHAYDSLTAKSSYLADHISTEILSNNNFIYIPSINSMNEHFHNFWITHIDKSIF